MIDNRLSPIGTKMKRITKTEFFSKLLITISQHHGVPADNIEAVKHVLTHFDIKTAIGTLTTDKVKLALLLAGAGLPLCYPYELTEDNRDDEKDMFMAIIQANAITVSDTFEIANSWGSAKPTLENLRIQYHGPWAVRIESARIDPVLLVNTLLPEPERTNQGIVKSSLKEYEDECRARNEQYWKESAEP